MDVVVLGALEEICSQGTSTGGLILSNLWPKIQTHLSANGLIPLSTNIKQALWNNLLAIPTLRFESNGVSYDAGDPGVQSVEVSEAKELRIVASDSLFDSFVGIYDIKASDSVVSDVGRLVLQRLARARTEGIAQNELAKELGIKNNNIFYILKGLESRGLIVRQSTIVRKKEAGTRDCSSIVHTNMLYLHRYAKHLDHLKRLEITKEDKISANNVNSNIEVTTGDVVSEEHIKDFVPDITAICDILEKADGKVLVVSDIKKELGYLKTHGHRKWRNILQRMKDARLVEEFPATVNKKEVSCLKLLKKFSLQTCVPKSHGGEDDDPDIEQVRPVKRGQVTEQLMELPIEQQIYDMIDAEGSNGLPLNDVYKRLGIKNKRYYPRILEMVSRFGMHLDSESLNKGVAYRAWTSGNYNTGVSNTTPGKVEDTMDDKSSPHAQAGQLMLSYTIEDVDAQTLNADAEASEEQNINDPLIDSRSSNNLQSEANGINPDTELQISNVKPAHDTVSLELSSSASPAPRVRRSYTTYPCLGLNSVNSLREQRILEKLQEEKILIRPELQRLLESLENLEKKHAVQMDKKTLERSLNKLQADGHCKCISFAVPSVTNCGRRRTIDVIIHPSEYNAEDLSDRVHDKLRLFERQIRIQSSRLKSSKGKSIPVLDDVERISTNVKESNQQETFEAMKNNGFVLAKMVRAKLLHIFLWGYLTALADWDDAILGQPGLQQKNPHSTCKLFELDAAIKAMPLELFLQVAGSAVKLEKVVEKCKNGLRLSDLPIDEYRCLMDTRATARFSYLIDILRRLKLIRLIGGELLEAPVGPHTTLRHSLEFKPYIEEPVGMFLPSTGVNSFDLRPHVRHDFVLASKKGVDEYWNTLEYCYAASDPKAAFHAFPGSVVHEVFLIRSWASARVMTAQQRSELSKLVANEDINKKITYKRCEKIAVKLNLTLEQVLRVFYDKRQKHKQKLASSAKEQEFQLLTHASLTYKRKRSSKEKSVNNESPLDEESGKLKQARILSVEDATEEQSSVQKSPEHETHMLINEMDGQKEIEDDPEPTEDEGGHAYPDIHDCAMSELQSSCQPRFSWTANKDRLLVIEYVKYRAARGSKFNRTDWTSLHSLPGPPATCKRRMSTLNRNKQFRKAVMKLCNMLSVRYAKQLENSKNKSLGDGCRTIIQDQNAPELLNHTKDFCIEERWDDFDNKDIKMLLDEVLRYKQIAKLEATKGARYVSKYPQSDVGGEEHKLDQNTLGSSATPINETKKDSGRRQASSRKRRQVPSRRSRRRLPKSYARLMNQVKNSGTQAYKSVAVSNAIELFKLVFLSSAKGPEVPNMLAETLRRYSEHDLFSAFNYLRDKKFMVIGSGASQFVLSQQFLHNLSLSPFPVNTGKKAAKMARWLQENENGLLENGVDLSADLQCGDVLQLCVLMCSGEISMFPCLPDEGVGEIEDLKKRKFDDNEVYSRKEKGFPGINLSLSSDIIQRVDVIAVYRDENAVTSRSNSEYKSLPSETIEGISKANADSELTWEAMTRCARHLASSALESSFFSPTLFKTVHSAIQEAGDQGLSMEEISEIIDGHGESMPELVVEVLEAFGTALKVNAYDSIRVVEYLYRSKYLLASVATHQHDLDLNTVESRQESHKDAGKSLTKETCTDCIDGHTTTDEAHHRLTILNRPAEVSQPTSEVQRNDEIETNKEENVMPPRTDPKENKFEFGVDDSPSFMPILPWVNGDGTINDIVYKGLVRRVLGIVMQNPGILEEHVLSQMDVLNPQSCRKLLELMILDSHIIERKMYQSVSNKPPAMLSRLLGCSSYKKPKLVCREHLFANPKSIHYL